MDISLFDKFEELIPIGDWSNLKSVNIYVYNSNFFISLFPFFKKKYILSIVYKNDFVSIIRISNKEKIELKKQIDNFNFYLKTHYI